MRNAIFALSILLSFFAWNVAQALTYSPGGITENTTWTKVNGPYLVDTLYIPAGVTLTIEPGTIVKLNQPGCNCYENIWVAGRIVAGALNATDRVVFTSVNDDIGGDTNNDGTTTIPTSGDWRQIFITQGGTLELYNTDVRYGGSAYAPHIYFNGDNIRQINNVGGAVIMDGADLAYGYIANYRQWFNEGSTTIRNSHIHDSGTGLTFSSGSATIEGNTFSAIGRAIEYPWNNTTIIHRNNHGTGVITHSGLLESDAILTPDTLPYSDGFLIIPAGVTLTVMPGSIIKGLGALTVSGTLIMGTATATDDVVITSSLDDTVGGDTNGDGAATTPQAGDWGAVIVTGSGRADIAYTTFRYGGAYTCDYWGKVCTIPVVNNGSGTLTITHSTITDGKTELLMSSGTTTITASELARGTYGAYIQHGATTINDSSIHDNATYGVFNSPANPTMVDATNNYWGSPTGPTHPSNPGGTGDRVSDNVHFTPWLGSDPTQTCTSDCYSVMFIPGLAGSRLYRGTDKVWFPFANGTDLDAKDLFLDASGTSIRSDIAAKDGDIVEDAYGIEDIYKGLPELLNSLRTSHDIADWKVAPYDWRLDYATLLSSGAHTGDLISYLTPTSTPYIFQTLRTLAAEAKAHKVIIVTHSNGGLLTKSLVKMLEDTHDPLLNNIEQVVLVAPPQLGAPKSIVSMLHGDENPLKKAGPLAMSNKAFRQLTENMPSMFNLLPSYAYGSLPSQSFASFDYPSGHSDVVQKAIQQYGVYDMDPLLNQLRSSYPNTNITRDNLYSFLTGENGQRVKPAAGDLTTPNVLSGDLLAHATEIHGALDVYHFPSSIKVTQVAGWGLPTISGTEYLRGDPNCIYFGFLVCKPTFALDRKPMTKADGDGTVPVASALAMDDATKVFVDIQTYNDDIKKKIILDRPREHDNIMGSQPIENLIEHLIKHESIDAIPYTSVTKPTGTHYIMAEKHSPVDLDVYDAAGNHTGYIYKIIDGINTRVIEENIPNSSYIVMGSSTYVIFPGGATTQVKLNGTGEGTMTFALTEYVDDVTIATTTFRDIPITASSTGMITVDTVASSSPLFIDENGDGTVDFSLVPTLNGEVTLPHPYRFTGFLQPINDTAVNPAQGLSVFKGGNTIPVKFQLMNASGTPIQAKTLPLWLTPQKLSAMNASVDESSYTDSGTSGSTFKWDSVSKQYIYNWNTKGFMTGYWYRLYAKLDDGTIQGVIVGLR